MNETLDAFFGGKLWLYQSRKGYRVSLDTLLLAHFARVKRGEKIVDLGTGNGVLPLILNRRYPNAEIVGVELQAAMVERAAKNLRLNCQPTRLQIVHGDVRAIERVGPAGGFDAAVSNPPFRKPNSGRLSPDDERRLARHEIQGNLSDFVRAANYLLRARGRLAMVYPSLRAVDLLAEMRRVGIEPKRLRPVHSFKQSEAALILVEGVKGGRSGLEIAPPLVVYRGRQRYTEEAAKIVAGTNL